MRGFLISALLHCSAIVVAAQNPSVVSEVPVDAPTRNAVIADALETLKAAYVFPEVAQKMEAAIRARQQRGEYDSITSARQFAQLLTEHLREISRDLHLSVDFAQPAPPPPPPPPGGGESIDERQRTLFGRENFGFARVERLPGNIGYVDLRGFVGPAFAGETATAAMTLLASSDAVIFDVRRNGGGDPQMVAYLTSYLFGSIAVHLNDFYDRFNEQTRQSWTLPHVPGRRLTNTDVYILTSSKTFSGAEEFTYNLKHLRRAVVVGENTAGAAHTVAGKRLVGPFSISVPVGRPINPVTKGNWEGVGVEPDVKVAADDALNVAHLLALEKQLPAIPPEARWLRDEATTTIAALRKELGAVADSLTASPPVQAVPASTANEDFESGALANWRLDQRGSGSWFAYDNGKVHPDRMHVSFMDPFNVPDPPEGKFAAITDASGPGRRILYRDIQLDGRYRVHMTVFYVNSGRFSAATATNKNTVSEEQQYRVDLLTASAPVDTMLANQMLATIFQSRPGDPSRRQPSDVTFDLSPWAGQTVRLRFVSADNQAPLRAGVDNIRFERIK